MFRWLTNLATGSGPRALRTAAVRVERARYDAAVTTDDNRRHWAAADGLSANAANNPEVRRVLRNRARYAVANNSCARGIVLTLANDVIGTGPRLQLLTDDVDSNRRIRREFARWTTAVRLAEKLRTMRLALATDGESFTLLTSNPKSPLDVQLDLKLVEAEQVTTSPSTAPGSGTARNTSIPPRKRTPKPRGSPTTPPPPRRVRSASPNSASRGPAELAILLGPVVVHDRRSLTRTPESFPSRWVKASRFRRGWIRNTAAVSVAAAQSHRFKPHCFQPVSSTFFTGASATAFRASRYAGSKAAVASRSKFLIGPEIAEAVFAGRGYGSARPLADT